MKFHYLTSKLFLLLILNIFIYSSADAGCDFRKFLNTINSKLGLVKTEKVISVETALPEIPASWWKNQGDTTRLKLELPEGMELKDASIPKLWLHKASKDPEGAVLADDIRGTKTNRDIAAGVYAFLPLFRRMVGRPGILLPPSAGSTVAMLAAQFSGKTPAVFNPTVGSRDFIHSMNISGVKKFLTSKAYVDGIKERFPEIAEFEDRFIYVEDLAKSTEFKLNFIHGKLRSKLPPSTWTELWNAKIDPVAMVIFTSGSSGTPKGVEVLHKNHIVNAMDILEMVPATKSDSMLGFLPHFHSFGAMGTYALPLIVDGFRVAYSPSPLKMKDVIKVAERYKSSIVVGTDTFFKFMAVQAKGDQLKSIRVAIAGAEPLKPETAERLAKKSAPDFKMLPAYGMTELGPGVFVADYNNPEITSVGKKFPHAEVKIVAEKEGKWEEVKPGEQGILIASGANLMRGYLGGKMETVNVDGKDWFYTGDMFSQNVNTGNYHIHGRASIDTWKKGGEMITRQKLEDVLHENLPSTGSEKDVFVVMPDKRGDKIKHVLITTQKKTEILSDVKKINAAVKAGGLSELYFIDRVVFVDEFPVLGTGKRSLKELKEIANRD